MSVTLKVKNRAGTVACWTGVGSKDAAVEEPYTQLHYFYLPGRSPGLHEGYSIDIQRAYSNMKTYTAIIEKCRDTGLYVGFIPGFAGAYSQAESLDELNQNLREVIEMLLEDGEPILEAEFVGTQNVVVA
ncbi:type II toxin-antitoxin system HicB family antitoxin [Methylomonas sp. SURF-2]|uniref:Type II toxin-antitoxin system HicB family antitoxin n=1 Tax=Methylomonas subterranea TaxID=2952225 RepID=A0ABT1TKM9_9GAMM|nr:type II toxin-antitoxin system HicB family antitoxin [Methylomonas sp. SURF-2]MCQ8106032.1 type II toxin-antitoxin system HicB family antitoxin [Methylomonas sp. SURF-2]